MSWFHISLAVAIVLVVAFLVRHYLKAAKNSYKEEDKTFHRPATLKPRQLKGFNQLSQPRQQLITEALLLASEHGWLKFKLGSIDLADGGFDCSGAMYYLLRKCGMNPPDRPAQQFHWIRDEGQLHKVPPKLRKLDNEAFCHLVPGDLMFWTGTYTPPDREELEISHVSMYLGQEKNGRHVLIGSTKGRKYRGKFGDGYGVYDFKLPRLKSKAEFVGYGTPVGLE